MASVDQFRLPNAVETGTEGANKDKVKGNWADNADNVETIDRGGIDSYPTRACSRSTMGVRDMEDSGELPRTWSMLPTRQSSRRRHFATVLIIWLLASPSTCMPLGKKLHTLVHLMASIIWTNCAIDALYSWRISPIISCWQLLARCAKATSKQHLVSSTRPG